MHHYQARTKNLHHCWLASFLTFLFLLLLLMLLLLLLLLVLVVIGDAAVGAVLLTLLGAAVPVAVAPAAAVDELLAGARGRVEGVALHVGHAEAAVRLRGAVRDAVAGVWRRDRLASVMGKC